MKRKKLDKNDLEEVKNRTELVNQHLLIADALEAQKRIFVRKLLPKYGCDMNKNYKINLKNGKIEEVEQKQKKRP